MELETGARKMLLSDDTIRGYVVSGDETRCYKHRLEVPVTGTGKIAIVVSRNGGWAQPDEVQTVEFPVLRVDVFADPTRFDDGGIRIMDGEDKGAAVLRVVDRLVHGRRGVWWGGPSGVLVVAAQRWREMAFFTQDDLHGRRLDLGDAVLARREYALSLA
jgi:hypothetical protein